MNTSLPMLICALCAASFAAGSSTALAEARLVAVHVVSRLADEDVATTEPKLATADKKAILSVVAVVEEDGARTVYGDAPRVRIPGRRGIATPTPWKRSLGPAKVRWSRVEPDTLGESYDNTSPSYHYDEIPYAETAILEGTGQWSMVADPRPTILQVAEPWVGTMRYKAEITALGATLVTPGAESRELGGASRAVHRVSYLGTREDAYVNTLLAFFNQPYVWGSMGPSDAKHQTSYFIGADCADLLTGARRVLTGANIPYSYSGAYLRGGVYAKDHGRVIAGSYTRATDGIFRDSADKPLTIGAQGTIRPGDVLVMPRHVGVLSEDRAPKGVLDANDLVIHTLFAEPREEPLLRRYSDLKGVFRWR